MEAVEQHLNARVGLDILVGEGLSVAAEKFPDVLGAARVARAEQDHVVVVLRHQREPAQDEGAHQNLAELRVPLHEGPEVLPVDGDDRSVARRARAHEAPASRQHIDLAGELRLAQYGDRLLTVAERPYELDRARQDDEKARVLLADVDEHFIGTHVAPLPEARNTLDLRRRELGEHLRGAIHD